MVDLVTYLAKTGQKVDLNKISQKLKLCSPVRGDKVCGMYDEFHITVFRDGEVWVDALAGSEQSRQLMKVADFLRETFGEQGIAVDFTNLLLNAKAIHGTVSPSIITHLNPALFRPQLGAGANINLFRLLVHWVLFNELGERWKDAVKQFGVNVGSLAYSSMADEIKDWQVAVLALKKFMKFNGLGVVSQITPKTGDMLRLMVDESLSSSGITNVGRRLCYLESGVIQGFFSKFYDRPVSCEEEKCWALGNDHCEFSIHVEE